MPLDGPYLFQQPSEWLHEIVDRRCGVRSIVLTSDRAVSDWLCDVPNPVIAGAVLDRLTHHAHQIQFTGKSVRKKLDWAAVHSTLRTQSDAI